jgi:hypothetical protein
MAIDSVGRKAVQRTCTGLIVFAFLTVFAFSQDGKQEYVGKSGCLPTLGWAPGSYSIRLDNNRRTSLRAYTVHRHNLLFIVQYTSDQDRCGIVRDVVRPKDATSSFIWDCMDPTNPGTVAVGTWPSRHPAVSGPAVEAWGIDPDRQKFVPFHAPVKCFNGFGAGADDGSDLITLARKRDASDEGK